MTWRDIIINFVRDSIRARTKREIIEIELREAYISRMNAESAFEYAKSAVDYNNSRIERLQARLKEVDEK